MSIPTTEDLLFPMLQFLQNGDIRTLKETVAYLATKFRMSGKDIEELQPSGRQTKFEKKVGWARYYLGKVGYIKTIQRGTFVITKLGIKRLRNEMAEISMREVNNIIEEK